MARCSESGRAYEVLVASTCAKFKSSFVNIPFNTQTKDELGGCSSRYDVSLNYHRTQDVHVEVKGKNAPDWIQTTLKPYKKRITRSTENKQIILWQPRHKSRATKVFEKCLAHQYIFDGLLPSFTHFQDWSKHASKFADVYVPCKNTSIATCYKQKGFHYIQVYGHGLYHTGVDVCSFGVPYFKCEQRVRIRCKRHGKVCKQTGESLPSSVVASLRPKLSTLPNSRYSLDAIELFPLNNHFTPNDEAPMLSYISNYNKVNKFA